METIVRWVWQRPRRVLAIAACAIVICGAVASRLALRSGLADLLRSDDPVAHEFTRIADRLPSTLMMVVSIEGPDREANLRAADALAARIAALGPRLVESVVGNVVQERAFFEAHKWLYVDLASLTEIRDAMRRAKNPLLVDIDDSPKELIARLRAKRGEVDRFASGYFEGEGGHFVVVLVRPARGVLGQDVGAELRAATLAIIDELHPAGVHVELGGNLIVGLGEREALMRDLARASLVCIVLVAIVVIGFFGRLRVVALFAVPALIGVAVGYAMAEVGWGFVNLSAAFMGTIIVGNGINFAIVQQARYDEERRRGTPALDAAIVAVRMTASATLVAALGAATAYGSLMLTQFRGFSQFGAVGATGMITAWLATIIVLPALWALFDHGGARRRFRLPVPSLGRIVRAPRAILAIGALLTLVAIAALPGYLADPFEYDLTKLRDRTAAASTTKNARVEAIFGQTVAPPVLLAERREQVPEIERTLRARAATPAGKRLIAEIRTIDDLVPADQPQKLAVLAEIRDMLDPDDPDRPPESLRAIAIADLPHALVDLFTERDGTVGRIVLIYDHSTVTAYDGHAQLAIDELIGEVPLEGGTIARTPVLFAALLRGIVHDAPIATGLSLLGVSVLVAVFERDRRSALVIATLAIGVLWLLGAAAWTGVKVNFLNFIALPITFGIGVDYAINMYRRAVLDGPQRALDGVGGALVLCSSTTIIGYSSLLFADNQALASFGKMAILGEVATLAAALTILPALLARKLAT